MVAVALVSLIILATYNKWVGYLPNPIFITGLALGGVFWVFVNMKRTFHGPVVRFLSDTSYSIYLLHYGVIALVSTYFDNKYAIVLVSLTAIFVLAYLSYRFIEKPCIQLGRRLADRRSSRLAT